MDMAVARRKLTDSAAAGADRSGADAANGTKYPALKRGQIGGRLSLVEGGPLAIDAQPGLWLRVRSGFVWADYGGDGSRRPLREGDHFFAERDGRLWICAVPRSEIEIEWPIVAAQQPSPRPARDSLAA